MCELVCVCIINVLFINITIRSKFCSYLCILSRDHYIYICIYIIYILIYGIKYLIIVNFCCITFFSTYYALCFILNTCFDVLVYLLCFEKRSYNIY